MYRDFIILSIVDLPGNIATVLLMDKVGRKKTIVTCMMMSGVACVSVGFVPDGGQVRVMTLILIRNIVNV